MKISACVIAKNEEKNIAKCFESYKDIISEIILVDTGSTDRTVEIAKQYGAKVFYYQWNNDFAAAKNFALERAKGQWIIFLDADEYLDKKSAQLLPGLLKKVDMSKHNAIGCKITNIDIDMNDRVIDSFMNIRVFKNDKNIRYRSNVHEGLYNKKGGIHVLALYDEIIIYHTGYSTSIVKTKAERNLKILLENIKKDGEHPSYYRYLCDCYLSTGDYENCIKYGRLHIESGVKPIGYESKVYKNIIDALYLKEAPRTEIELEIKKAIAVFPKHPNFYYVYGFFLHQEKHYEEALQNLLKAEQLNSEYRGIEVNFAAGMLKDIYLKIGYLFELKNQEDQALTYYYQGLKKDKYNGAAFQALFRLIRTAKANEAVSLLNTIYSTDSEHDVEFLVDELKKIKAGEIFGYYVNIWKNKFGKEDNSLAFLLLAMGRYDTAFNIFYTGVVQDPTEKANCILAAVAAIAGGKKEYIEKLVEVAGPSLRKILLKYSGQNIDLAAEDRDDYLSLFREIALLNKQAILDKYSEIALECPPEVSFKAAVILQDYQLYAQAIKLFNGYLSQIAFTGDSVTGALMGLGYCYYKLREYKSALGYFHNAVEKGYKKNDVYEFIRWSEHNVNSRPNWANAVGN